MGSIRFLTQTLFLRTAGKCSAWPAMCSRRRGHSSAAALDSARGERISGSNGTALLSTRTCCNLIAMLRLRTMLFCALAAVAANLAANAPAHAPPGRPPRLVLIDQDGSGPGGSNQMAMMVLLQSRAVQVLGIPMVSGNAWEPEGVQHTLRMLELIGRSDVPVVPGAVFPLLRTEQESKLEQPLIGTFSWYGAWGDLAAKTSAEPYHGPYVVPPLAEGEPRTRPLDEDAAHFLIRQVHAHPHQVTILSAPHRLAEQDPRDRQRLGDQRRHVGQAALLLGRDPAAYLAHAPRHPDEQRHEHERDRRQAPVQQAQGYEGRDHRGRVLGDRRGGRRDHAVQAADVVGDPRLDLAGPGAGEEGQRHPLQAAVDGRAQIVHHPLPDDVDDAGRPDA